MLTNSFTQPTTNTKFTRLRAVLGGAILVLIVFSVIQTNNQARYSFSIKQLENERNILNQEIERLTWETGQARSAGVIAERAREMSLTMPASVDFLVSDRSTVAVAAATFRQ